MSSAGVSKKDQEFDWELLKDNESRLNRAYMIDKRSIELIDHILVFLAHNLTHSTDKQLALKDYLTPADWRIIREIVVLLKPFYSQTKRLQS